MKENKSCYQQWDKDGADFGGFATSLFKTYQIADKGNRQRLETAFPDYFQ